MTDFVKNAWMFFIASLFFGVWVIPMLLGYILIIAFIQWMWPDFFDKYM